MLDKFDYAEPACALCDGKEFYYPNPEAPLGRIPVSRVIDKVDSLFHKNDYTEAGRLLVYWKNEAVSLKDKQGELAMQSELVGYYRKQNDKEQGLAAVERALMLIDELKQGDTVSSATILINCATAYKAFDMAQAALPLYRRAETIYQANLPADDSRRGGLYNNMALALADVERFEEAEAAYDAALKVMTAVPRGGAEAAITYINLAHLYEQWSRGDEIKPCMDKAYTLLIDKALPRDGYYAFILEKCAPSFAYFGNEAVAEQLKKESEEIYARA